MSAKQQQIVIAVSATAKQFVKDCTEAFSAPSKSKDMLNASEREVFDGLVKFVKDFRFTTEERFKTEVNEAGELITLEEVEEYQHDHLADIMNEVLAERMNITRVVSSGKVKELEAREAELLAQLEEYKRKLEEKAAPSANEY